MNARSMISNRHPDTVFRVGFIVLFAAYVAKRLVWLHSMQPDYSGFAADVIGLIAASAALMFFAVRPVDIWSASTRTAVSGALMGIIVFVSTIGFGLVDPTYTDWLLRGDWAQHFLGWQFYRNANWTWPPGAFDTWLYPVGTSIIYTDSLPLLAMPLKAVAPWLPDHFQYIGFWFLCNSVMQGVFGALLIACFTRSAAAQTVGAGLLLLAPVFLARLPHDTLTTQWLILASLWMYFREFAANPLRGWLVIAAVTALVHPYLSAMVLTLMFAFYASAYVRRSLRWQTVLIHVASAIAITLVCWWLSGVFILKIRSGFEQAVYSANLLTWFDSEGWSRWLPALPQSGVGQYEGFGYLGAGVLVLTIVAPLLAFSRRSPEPLFHRSIVPLVIAVAALSVFAFSTRLTIGELTLLDVTPKHLPLLGAFRCSGRFIWASVYLITLVVVAVIARRGGRFTVPLLGIAFFVQLLDLAPLHVSEARMRVGQFSSKAEVPLHDPQWTALVAGRHHIQLVPAAGCGAEAAPYFALSMLAADHGMSINTAYLARMDGLRWEGYCADAQRALDAGARDRDTLYIVHPTLLEFFKSSSKETLDCRPIENIETCVVGATPLTTADDFDPVFDCFRVNYAWGFSMNGVSVGRDGRIVGYGSHERDNRGAPSSEGSQTFYPAAKLKSVYVPSTALGSVDVQTLDEKIKLIASAEGDLERAETGARDAGSLTCHAYIYDSVGARYRDIPLGSDGGVGDFRLVNRSPAAARLMEWLQSIGVANK